MKPTVLSQFIIAVLAAALVFGAFQVIKGPSKNVIIEHVDGTPAKNTVFTLDEKGAAVPLDFTGVAEKSLGAVVHILSVSGTSGRPSQEDLLREFFGQRRSPRVGSGSGVIINPEGYIVTNNHVIQGADDLEVTLHDKRNYKATLIGTDPQTDIAVIKIEEKGLQSLNFTNSDNVRVGQWVLAIGNPFNLNSTVTAGIVSAKGRSIEIFDRSVGGIESFIQTDAAINPGNSGGALIDLNGSLVGINTAIASQTGTYSGYGFAVPANLASRVVSDLIQYGSPQRGYLGVQIQNVDGALAKQQNLKITEGAYISSVMENGAAQKAGLKANDVVIAINEKKVTSSSELMEIVGSHRIGDKLKLKVNRDGSVKDFEVELKNQAGTTAAVTTPKGNGFYDEDLGATLSAVDATTAQRMGIRGGVQVKNIGEGIFSASNIEEGFIITRVNRQPVTRPEEVIAFLQNNTDGVLIEGYYPGQPEKQYYAIRPK